MTSTAQAPPTSSTTMPFGFGNMMDLLKFKLFSEASSTGWVMILFLLCIELYNRHSSVVLEFIRKQVQLGTFWIKHHCNLNAGIPAFKIDDFKTTLRVTSLPDVLHKVQRERNRFENLKYRNYFELRSQANNFLDILGYEQDATTFYPHHEQSTSLANICNRMYVDSGHKFGRHDSVVPLYKNNSCNPSNWYYYATVNNSDKTWDAYLCSNGPMDRLQLYLATLLEKYKLQSPELYCLSNMTAEVNRLYSSKTFDSLFFEQKENIMRVLNQFKTQKHVYLKRGIPHHLTFLLTGHPGCGKTSFIKSMAKYFNRSIYRYHINEKTTQSEFEKTITAQSHHIIIFEDFDRIETIVKIMSNDQRFHETKTFDAKDDFIPEHLKVLQASYEDEKDAKTREVKFTLFKKEYLEYQDKKHDKLNLQCLLNIIDGVQEHPGRIIIFTCNHIERLNKAFLRPGRMDFILEFKKCNKQIVHQILDHYYNYDTTKFKFDTFNIPDYKYSAAEVMSVCKLYQHPKQVVKHLSCDN